MGEKMFHNIPKNIVATGRIVRQKVMVSLALGGGKRGGKLLLPRLARQGRGDRDRGQLIYALYETIQDKTLQLRRFSPDVLPRPQLSERPAPLSRRDAPHARHVSSYDGPRLQGEHQDAHPSASTHHRAVPRRAVKRQKAGD